MKRFFSKLLILSILFLLLIISFKRNITFKTWFKNNLLTNNISLYKIKQEYSKIFGGILPFDKLDIVEPVFNEKLEYKGVTLHDNYIELDVDNNYYVPSINSGIITFIGDLEDLKDVVVVEGDIYVIYSNINTNLKLYDEVKTNDYIGETKDNKLYIQIKKDGNIEDYKKYI